MIYNNLGIVVFLYTKKYEDVSMRSFVLSQFLLRAKREKLVNPSFTIYNWAYISPCL